MLRNNIAHGRSYIEILFRQKDGSSIKQIENDNYEKVRLYLQANKIVHSNDSILNTDGFWEFGSTFHFYFEVKNFLFDTLKNISFTKKDDMLNELIRAYEGCI